MNPFRRSLFVLSVSAALLIGVVRGQDPPANGPGTDVAFDRVSFRVPGEWTVRNAATACALLPGGKTDDLVGVIYPTVSPIGLSLDEVMKLSVAARARELKCTVVAGQGDAEPKMQKTDTGVAVSMQTVYLRQAETNAVTAILMMAFVVADGVYQPMVAQVKTAAGQALLREQLLVGLNSVKVVQSADAGSVPDTATTIRHGRLELALPGSWKKVGEPNGNAVYALENSGTDLMVQVEAPVDPGQQPLNRLLDAALATINKDREVLEQSEFRWITRPDGAVVALADRVVRAGAGQPAVHAMVAVTVLAGHLQAIQVHCRSAEKRRLWMPAIERAIRGSTALLPEIELIQPMNGPTWAHGRANCRMKLAGTISLDDSHQRRPDQARELLAVTGIGGVGAKVRVAMDVQFNAAASPKNLLGRFLFTLLHPDPDDAKRFTRQPSRVINMFDGRAPGSRWPCLLMEIGQPSDDGRTSANAFGALVAGHDCCMLIGVGGPREQSPTGITVGGWQTLCSQLAASAGSVHWVGGVTWRDDIEKWLTEQGSFHYYFHDASFHNLGDTSFSSSSSTLYDWKFREGGVADVKFEDKSTLWMTYSYSEPLNTWNASQGDYAGLNPNNPVVDKSGSNNFSSNPEGFEGTGGFRVATTVDGSWLVFFHPDGETSLHRLEIGTHRFTIDGYLSSTTGGGPSTGGAANNELDLQAVRATSGTTRVELPAGGRTIRLIASAHAGFCSVSTAGDADTVVDVLSTSGKMLATNDDAGGGKRTSFVRFPINAGQAYLLCISTFDGSAASVPLTIDLPAALPAVAKPLTSAAPARVDTTTDAVFAFTPARAGSYRFAADGAAQRLELYSALGHELAHHSRTGPSILLQLEWTVLANTTCYLRVVGGEDIPAGMTRVTATPLRAVVARELPNDVRRAYFARYATEIPPAGADGVIPPGGVALLRVSANRGGATRVVISHPDGGRHSLWSTVFDADGQRVTTVTTSSGCIHTLDLAPGEHCTIELQPTENDRPVPYRAVVTESGTFASRAAPVTNGTANGRFAANGDAVHKVVARGGRLTIRAATNHEKLTWLRLYDANGEQLESELFRKNGSLTGDVAPDTTYFVHLEGDDATTYSISLSETGPLLSRAEPPPSDGNIAAFRLLAGAERVFGLQSNIPAEVMSMIRVGDAGGVRLMICDAAGTRLNADYGSGVLRVVHSIVAGSPVFVVIRNENDTDAIISGRIGGAPRPDEAGTPMPSPVIRVRIGAWRQHLLAVRATTAGQLVVQAQQPDGNDVPLAVDVLDADGAVVKTSTGTGNTTLITDCAAGSVWRIRVAALHNGPDPATITMSVTQRANPANRAINLGADGTYVTAQLEPYRDRVYRIVAPPGSGHRVRIDTRSSFYHKVTLRRADGTEVESDIAGRSDKRYQGSVQGAVTGGEVLYVQVEGYSSANGEIRTTVKWQD